ncbi:hypothetical protein C1637_04680 [Chryseobacterium lactis]|uniref:Uncharacterized protein n=1 Tax=Chryseobacterium lactis TaxID=1241981 RepID=A0A3G6RZ39_CHRLC|nr:hypothetical protein [Chryseobacterium lactis]AZA81873.1 hypothetical protein EG342_08070 [Chryseobacterium lactis]AZB06870.1 hypothetical protein EG341_24185 [Chryseobacterium lactis]PNW15723.1 hypothetical protein C1637_04680 [Chryseobacterium lactis]
MKKIFFVLLTFIALHGYRSQASTAKEKEVAVELKELAISNPPSVILLGISPSELETPKSKKAIVLSLVNSFKKSEGIPDAYAFEITPYWLLPSKNMNSLKYAGFKEYNGKIYKQNIFTEIKKSSVSLGFVRDLVLNADDDIKNPAFSISARGTFIRIRTQDNLKNIVKEDSAKKARLKLISMYLSGEERKEEGKKIEQKCIDDHLNDADCEKLLTELSKKLLKKYDENVKEANKVDYYRNLLEAPPLFSVDFAGGYSTFFSDNKFSNNHFGKLGFWLTLNTGFDFTKKDKPDAEKTLNFYGIVRFLDDGTNLDDNRQFLRSKNYDFGGKAEFTYKRFSISYEYIYRINDLDKTFRSSGLIAYKVSDKVYINAAFGKNYGEKDNLISFLGLNWGIDSEKKSVFVNTPDEKKIQ